MWILEIWTDIKKKPICSIIKPISPENITIAVQNKPKNFFAF